MSVIWHDLECGPYTADLDLWRRLASERGGPVLEIGAGTGRVSLALAREGHSVTALERDPELAEELHRRAAALDVTVVVADAREFKLAERHFALCIVPMQAIQLLGGAAGRERFLRHARAHLGQGGVLAAALAEIVDLYEYEGGPNAPLPDICEREGVVYSSLPTAVRADPAGFVLERRRERVSAGGERTVEDDRVRIERLGPAELEHEAQAVALQPAGRERIPPTADYSGSVVVMLRA